jgi:hypothetical protein
MNRLFVAISSQRVRYQWDGCASYCLMNAGPTSSHAEFSCTSQFMRGNRSDAPSSSSAFFACVLSRLIMRSQAASSPYVQRNMTNPHFFSGFARRSACTSLKCGDIVSLWGCGVDTWWKTIAFFRRAVLGLTVAQSVLVAWQQVFPNTVRGLHSFVSAFVKLSQNVMSCSGSVFASKLSNILVYKRKIRHGKVRILSHNMLVSIPTEEKWL